MSAFIIVTFLVSFCQGVDPADVALYTDQGADENCVTATEAMFTWMGFTVSHVSAEYINLHDLEDFRLICFPGGDMYQYSQDLSSLGREHIRAFIARGGAYCGICGGAYFSGHTVFWQGQELPITPLGLFPGTTRGPIDTIAPYPYCVMCKLDIVDTLHPITVGQTDSAWVAYCYGPHFEPDAGVKVDILARYAITHSIAMVACTYGDGRVFIIGTHPEFEEDSERDNVDFGDSYDDRGSEWPLMQQAMIWCLQEIVYGK